MVSYAGNLPPSRSTDSDPVEPLPLGPSCIVWVCLRRFRNLQIVTTVRHYFLCAAGPLPGLLLVDCGLWQGCDKHLRAAGLH